MNLPVFIIKLAQEALAARGLYGGSIDADWGPMTQSAYNEYVNMNKPKPEALSDLDVLNTGSLNVSEESIDLIVKYETGGKSYYEKFLKRPTWPRGFSGVTIGIGFDLGYNDREQIRNAWEDYVTDEELQLLMNASGKKGQSASNYARSIRNRVDISWDAAKAVFEEETIPRYSKLALAAFPDLDMAHPHIQGAILSIVFNRGSKVDNSDRRREMKAIKHLIKNKRYDLIPDEIKNMKRLWRGKGLDGLLKRRDAEAALVKKAL